MPDSVENLLLLSPLSALLGIAVLGFAIVAWARGQGNLSARLRYSAVALAALAHLSSMLYWNILLYHFR